MKNNLTPLFCIGETLDERNYGSYYQVLEKQLDNGVFTLSAEDFAKIVEAI